MVLVHTWVHDKKVLGRGRQEHDEQVQGHDKLVGQQEQESLFGSALSWSRAGQGGISLAVAAERSSLGCRLGGAVLLYDITT